MKNNNIFKSYSIAFLTAVSSMVLLTACDKNDDDMTPVPDQMYTISGAASGDQEVPVVSTAATGSLTGSYNASTNQLIYTINWNGLSGDASMAHFHGPAAVGVNGGVLLPLEIETNGVTGIARDTITIADSVETALLAGNVYYNLHTVANPDGEIRGQVVTARN